MTQYGYVRNEKSDIDNHPDPFFSAALLFSIAAQSLAAELLASKTSDKYHNPDCELVKQIKPAALIKFASPKRPGR